MAWRDMATSQVAANRVWAAIDEGRPISSGWPTDKAGKPTTDPAAIHAMVPLGGYKGYGLELIVEVLSGVLGGAGVGSGVSPLFEADDLPQRLGHFHLSLDPERTVGRARFATVLRCSSTCATRRRPTASTRCWWRAIRRTAHSASARPRACRWRPRSSRRCAGSAAARAAGGRLGPERDRDVRLLDPAHRHERGVLPKAITLSGFRPAVMCVAVVWFGYFSTRVVIEYGGQLF
jgi:hypothetical protein